MYVHSLKLLIFSVLALFLSQGMSAKDLGADEARKIAGEFFAAGNCSRLANASNLKLVHTSANALGKAEYYVFNAVDGKGFIIVAANDNVEPVIGFSFENSYDAGMVPGAAASMLGNMGRYITSAPASNGAPRRMARAAAATEKMINTAEWSQEAPFNDKIPNRRLTGCVGVAMATIMRYHEYPPKGTGSIGDVDFNVSYDWTNMRKDNYRGGYSSAEADAVSTLVAHAAQSILTDFGMSSSSAFEVRVPSALINYFGYDAGVSYKKRAEMDKASWDALIVSEIDADRPVLYSGQDVSAGHAFVCDGYQMMGSEPYFHINWGWGGTANGYFRSDALNPSASRNYSFNDQTTIVYNIRPASVVAEWSPIHLTSDGKQIGMTTDVTDLVPGGKFTVRAGALKNIANEDYSGTLSIALFTADGAFKKLLDNGKGFGLQMLQIRQYVDFSCTVPADAVIGDGDIIRLVTKANGSDQWLPVAGDLLVIGTVPAKGNNIPYFTLNIPSSVDGADITCPNGNTVIKGRDFTFNVAASSPEKVVTVKANGFILSPDANNNYRISNVNSDQEIAVIVQNASDVVAKRNLWVTAGGLSSLISETESGTITDLTLYGSIDVNDFNFIRERMKLSRLDISGVNIVANGSNPANAIPSKAFQWYGSLKEIVLPKNLTTLKNGCFCGTSLTSVEIPASVGTWEYNVFLGCSSLSEVISRRANPAWINWCVFQGTPKAKLVVPVGSAAKYQAKDNWKDFKNVVEENPVAATSYTVALQEVPGVKITPETEGTVVEPGSSYVFTVETDDTWGDATMEVYANSTRLYADAAGKFTATINANTLLHTNFKRPEATIGESTWKITGVKGGAGLVTEVVNVVPGKAFSIRVNALAIPSDDAAMFYAAVLTDKDGGIKEFISPIINNSPSNHGDLPCNFSCQVKEASVREGNFVRVATSYNKKTWRLVNAANDSISDRIKAVGNEVKYHTVNMPSTVQGAVIQGAVTQAVHGMPLNIKVTPVSVADRISIAVNGVVKFSGVAIANLSIPAVTEDLDIAIQVNPAGEGAYQVVNVREGELAAKIADLNISRLKVIGQISSSDFKVFADNAASIKDLDLADVTIKGAGDKANAIPTNAFASGFTTAALTSVILPANLTKISEDAFYRCFNLTTITLPATVEYVGDKAFSGCVKLNKVIMQGSMPPVTSSDPFFGLTASNITLEVPRGAEDAYSKANYWNALGQKTSDVFFNIQIDPTRACNYNESVFILTKIPYPVGKATSISLGLPNCTLSRTAHIRRPGVAYKIYDNGKDVTYTSSYIKYGQHNIVMDPDPFYQPGSAKYPQDHIIDVVFHYAININFPEGVAPEFVGLEESNIWRGVDMSLFVQDSGARPNLFKEGEDYGFVLKSTVDNMDPKVKATSRVMTKIGANPEYTVTETVLTPDENGVYTVANLQGDVTVDVTLVPADGAKLTSEDIVTVDSESASDITTVSVGGEVTPEAFDAIRDNFNNLETLDLSEMENTEIPANAFEGMESLTSVVIPDNVTTIGQDAFNNCSQLESVSLTSVDQIGANAFSGCNNLTSITIAGSSSAPAEARRRAPRANGINDESFNGINPNCLIFVSDANIALTEKYNVILNTSGNRQAMSDITLSPDYAFNTPGSFNLGDKTISITVPVGHKTENLNDNWTGLVLPFTPSSMTVGGQAFKIGAEGENSVSLRSFADAEAENLTDEEVIEANVPYMIRINGAAISAESATSDVLFTATGKTTETVADGDNLTSADFDVQTTPSTESMVRSGKEFSMFGNYAVRDYAEGEYALDETGSEFRLIDTEAPGTTNPFTAYIKANNGSAPSSFAVSNEDPVTGIKDVEAVTAGDITISRSGSLMIIDSASEGSLDIYDLRGIRVASLTLVVGRNSVELPAGIYIVNGIKVIM